jgi:hypothetical protein
MAEDSRAAEDARQYAEEVTRRLNASILPGACGREQLLYGDLRGLFSGVDVHQYVILDERAEVAPAPARPETETL